MGLIAGDESDSVVLYCEGSMFFRCKKSGERQLRSDRKAPMPSAQVERPLILEGSLLIDSQATGCSLDPFTNKNPAV